MATYRTLYLATCLGMGLVLSGFSTQLAHADVKCSADGSMARTADVSAEEMRAECESRFSGPQDASQPLLDPQEPSGGQSTQSEGIQSVPGPSGLVLILTGLIGIFGLRRK